MHVRSRSTHAAHVLGLCIATALGTAHAQPLAQPEAPQTLTAAYPFDLPAQPLAKSLRAIARQANANVLFDTKDVDGVNAPALRATLTASEAIERVLVGSGLSAQQTAPTTMVIRRVPGPGGQKPQALAGDGASPADEELAAGDDAQAPSEADSATATLDTITVTGTRIKGGTTASPVITIGSKRMREEGFTDLGDVIRSLPQNFSGGQNPGVAAGAILGGTSNVNYTGGSTLNLRGLGPDATLTLLNGRRMAYDGAAQAVDISAIPVEAVERIEIVPDGASAIYGSDAVGGVANVILKRDFDGVTIGTRYGTATEGGLSTREYTATGGTTWNGGGLIATWKKASSDPVFSDQRGYTTGMNRPTTLYPGLDSYNILMSAHQELGDVAELRLDALKTHRQQAFYTGYPSFYYRYATDTSISLLSPSISFTLPRDWSLVVGGTYGKDESDFASRYVSSTASILRSSCNCNESRSYEVGGEGPLFALAGGDARLALGIGTRTDDYQYRSHTSTVRYGGDERTRYAYAELNLPLIAPASYVAGIRRLEMSMAVRAEDYDSFGHVATPKLGLIYDPSADVTLKASWGKSFKAPTLVQRYSSRTANLLKANAAGGSGYAADSTVLASYGGNTDLQPERARTWTASVAFHPQALPALDAELTWFDIDYTDRVGIPIPNFSKALSDPAYADFVSYSATPEAQAALLSVYSDLYNYAGVAYDPAKVVAIIRDQYLNAARQRIHGLDLSGSYRVDLADSRLTFRGSASWLDSSQQNSRGQDFYDLAGTIFHPAKYKGRVGAVWSHGGFNASGFLNYTSGVTSTLTTTKQEMASFTTADATLRYDMGPRVDGWSGFSFELSAQNLFNRTPPLYTTTAFYYVPYDSTNYSAIGRFLSVSVSKAW